MTMMERVPETRGGGVGAGRGPLLYLALNVVLVAGGQLLLKRGAAATAQVVVPAWLSWLGITALGSGWVWAAILCHLLGFASWLRVLRWIPLSLAFPAASVVHVLVPLGAWWLLGERIGAARWCGIGLILVGIWCIARPLMVAEEVL